MMSSSVPSFRMANVCGIHISTTNRLVLIIHIVFESPWSTGCNIISTSPQGWWWSQSRILIPASPMLHYVSATTESVHATNPIPLTLSFSLEVWDNMGQVIMHGRRGPTPYNVNRGRSTWCVPQSLPSEWQTFVEFISPQQIDWFW